MSGQVTEQLCEVDALTITFLVDNCIEWMSTLPPGFTHELPQHLSLEPEADSVLGVPVLNFNNFCCGAHGFSALVETQVNHKDKTESFLTLFDTGPDSSSLVRNLRGMQVPIEKISRVILSHWHSDHSGGLLSFLNLRKEIVEESNIQVEGCIIDVHPDRPIARGIAPRPTYDKVICALQRDPTFEEIEKAGGVVDTHAEGHAVAGGSVWVSGEIPRITAWEGGIPGGKRWIENRREVGEWTSEPHIMDERYAAIDVRGKGLVIFSACSHAGIVNVVKDASQRFQRSIYMIIGGLHLAGSEFADRIPLTVDYLSNELRPAPVYVLPMHCSGFQAKVALEDAFGEGCVPAGVGLKVNIVGDEEGEQFVSSGRT